MERLKNMKEQLVSIVQSQLGDIKSVDTKELGEAVDMIKDLSEAIYYCTVTEAMKENSEDKEHKGYDYYKDHYDPERERRYYPIMPYYDDDRRVYYNDDRDNRSMKPGSNGMGPHYYREYEYPRDITRRDPKEGRSPISRKMYMESKELHQDAGKKMQELETYMQELTSDLIEMISDATPEEKQLLKSKISTLSSKIV